VQRDPRLHREPLQQLLDIDAVPHGGLQEVVRGREQGDPPMAQVPEQLRGISIRAGTEKYRQSSVQSRHLSMIVMY
jgi:hypothetical protein